MNKYSGKVDASETSDLMCEAFREDNIFLGGSSMGQGLRKAARYYIGHHMRQQPNPDHFYLEGASDLNEELKSNPVENSFYVCDIGVVISQFWQWRKHFPRVEPFYAVKCNPDPLIIKTLAILGSNFDCASRTEFRLVQDICKDLPRNPDIIYANPCKSRVHLIEAVCKGIRKVTFDNAAEIVKCAEISKKIQLVLRIITDDRGSQCRLSTKFGAPRQKWRPLLATAKKHGLDVVGVSFHVGSGCRDADRYQSALKDAKEIFEMAKTEFGFNMTLLDIGGGFPGETHSTWNPAAISTEDEMVEEDSDDEGDDLIEGTEMTDTPSEADQESEEERFMFFTEIADRVRPMLDEMFPEESGVRLIAEPGRYFVAAYATLVTSVVSCRDHAVDSTFVPESVDDKAAAKQLESLKRNADKTVVAKRGVMFNEDGNPMYGHIMEEMADYSKMFAKQQLAQQESDVYNDPLDLYKEGFNTAVDLLGPPEEDQKSKTLHSVEGMNKSLVADASSNGANSNFLTFAAAGEAAVNGIVLQAVADSDPLQDNYSYYINDGCYGGLNNLVFDHATVRARHLRIDESCFEKVEVNDNNSIGLRRLKKSTSSNMLKSYSSSNMLSSQSQAESDNALFASTIFGPTCDSIDVIARSVLLPKLKVGDWLYFQNMGAYTSAAASTFNGFAPSEKFHVCSIMPSYFAKAAAGPECDDISLEEEEKKDSR